VLGRLPRGDRAVLLHAARALARAAHTTVGHDNPRRTQCAVPRAALGVAAGAIIENRGLRSSGWASASSRGLPRAILWEDRSVRVRRKSLILLERAKGIEPSTYSLGSCRSTTELRPRSEVSPGAAG